MKAVGGFNEDKEEDLSQLNERNNIFSRFSSSPSAVDHP